jgi:AcrR family transcriptional regulator
MSDSSSDGSTTGLPARRSRRKEQPTALYAERRKELLAAAAIAFRDLGYQRATLGDVAKQAGVNRASVYYYFSTKEDALLELISGPLLLNTRRMGKILRSDSSSAEKVGLAIADLMAAFDDNYPALTIYFEERFDRILAESTSPRHGELFNALRRYLKMWEQLLEQGRESGELQFEGSARITSFMIMGIITYTSRWYRPGGSLTTQEISKIYTKQVLNGLLPR